ncbi:hypothetical protein HF086_012606 [Spodoptera exigua]|uniref:Uncharacterized protein n=1 Tax=Spodoptera exigua TaxID=7107 RepID=A0A922SDH8_SPOEX|nr:hypothetical protein HF086_012606 [Spodoptera exigua]
MSSYQLSTSNQNPSDSNLAFGKFTTRLRNTAIKMRIYGFLGKKVGDLTIKYSNFPESYVKRSYEQVYWKNPSNYPQYPKAQIARKQYRFTTNRPWTGQFRLQNDRNMHRKKVFVEPVGDWSFFK